jgi:hypothetical protein
VNCVVAEVPSPTGWKRIRTAFDCWSTILFVLKSAVFVFVIDAEIFCRYVTVTSNLAAKLGNVGGVPVAAGDTDDDVITLPATWNSGSWFEFGRAGGRVRLLLERLAALIGLIEGDEPAPVTVRDAPVIVIAWLPPRLQVEVGGKVR